MTNGFLKAIGSKAATFVGKNAATILTVSAVFGVVATAALAGRAAVIAKQKIDELKKADEDFEQPVTKKEIVKETWYYFAPAVVCGGLTIGAIVTSNRINLKNQAALVAAYAYSEKKLEEYRDKVTEIVGVKKEQKVRDEIAQDHVSGKTVNDKTIIVTGGGDVLCMESITGQMFRSSVEKIRQAANIVNKDLMSCHWAELNMFYEELGLKQHRLGDTLGFSIDKPVELDISTTITDNNEPCIVVDYKYLPMPREPYL